MTSHLLVQAPFIQGHQMMAAQCCPLIVSFSVSLSHSQQTHGKVLAHHLDRDIQVLVFNYHR